MRAYHPSDKHQGWQIKDDHHIRNYFDSKLVVDIKSKPKNGASVVAKGDNGKKSQCWRFDFRQDS